MKTSMLKLLLLAVTFGFGALRPTTGAAITYTWQGGSSLIWGNPLNWTGGNPGFFPGLLDDAVFPAGNLGKHYVYLNAPQSIKSLGFYGTVTNFFLIDNGGFGLTLNAAGSITNNSKQFSSIGPNLVCGTTVGSATIRLEGTSTSKPVLILGNILNQPNLNANGSFYVIRPPSALTLSSLTVGTGGWLEISVEVPVNVNSVVTVNSGGTLRLCNPNNIPAGVFTAPAINVLAGATVNASASVKAGIVLISGTISAGCSPGALVLTGNLFFDNTATLDFELATPGVVGGPNDLITVDGDLVLDGTVNVTGLTGFKEGSYRLCNYSGAFINNGVSLGKVPSGYGAKFDFATPHQVNLVVSWDGPDTNSELNSESEATDSLSP